ncbi:voltage-dependent T-type calcium channel subunit alpha-1H-like [Harpia harpyja]|uniref:voltage-dependent T-type calcium channel subunit alpha-1H-like n=1 Tax=Harpia harpyja TaxID=202280 RepID=UPI0022B1DE93|nr:voltage-dependent T-type calcium channel subunit alpha-1H-like [Harpia harpyja]
MTDGESREPLPRPAGGEVRVPITAPPRRPAEQQQQQQQQPPEEEEEEDAGSGPVGSPCRDPPPDLASEEEEQVPYPALAPTAFFCLKQTTRPRSWCLRLVCNPYPFPEGHQPPPPPAGKEEDSQASKSHPPSPESFTRFINVK